jgi:hypothetical protein
LELCFQNYGDFYSKCNNRSYHDCSKCKGLREVKINPVRVIIDNRGMNFNDIPVLECTSCGAIILTDYAKKMIEGCYKYMVKEDLFEGTHKYKGYKRKFGYCKEWPIPDLSDTQ